MGKRDEWIEKYADDLKNKCGMTPDMDLLTKVTIGCGPSIYNADAQTVASSQQSELELVKENFLASRSVTNIAQCSTICLQSISAKNPFTAKQASNRAERSLG